MQRPENPESRSRRLRMEKIVSPQSRRDSNLAKSVAEKAAYSRAATRKLAESRARLDGVKAAIRHAVATGRVEPTEELERAQRAMAANLKAAEFRLAELRKSSETEWEDLRVDLDDAWEDLFRSVKQLVSRYTDQEK